MIFYSSSRQFVAISRKELYYPHGGVLPGRNYQNTLGVPYQYQGIEKDPETNLLNFELRQFDARLGRWQGPDPMGEFHSPYLAMGNNPVSTTDPTGGYTSDQFWNSSDAPQTGAYSHLNIGVEDRRDGAQINEMPVADPDKHSYLFMTPKERRNVQAMNGTSYEHQALNIMIEMVNAFGSYTSQGKTFMYSQKRQQYGYWQDWSSTSGAVMVYKQGTEDGKMSVSTTGRFTVGSVWNNSGVNGSLHHYLWAQKTYGGQGDGSFMDDVLYTVSTFNSRWNPIAHLMNGMNGVWQGTDRFGNKQSGWETTVQTTSGVLFLFGGAIADAYVGATIGEANIVASKPLVSLGLGSTGRTTATNLTEQLAMEEIMSNPSIGRIIKTGLKDQRWSGWVKMSNEAAHGIEIHYVGQFKNGVLIAVDDFKFIGGN